MSMLQDGVLAAVDPEHRHGVMCEAEEGRVQRVVGSCALCRGHGDQPVQGEHALRPQHRRCTEHVLQDFVAVWPRLPKQRLLVHFTLEADRSCDLSEAEAGVDGELRREVLHCDDLRPCLDARGAHKAEDPEEVIDLRVGLEQGLPSCGFCEQAPHRPHVHLRPIDVIPEDQLRRTVPETPHLAARAIPLLGVLGGIGLERYIQHARRREIAELDDALGIDKDIVRLQVPVHDPLVVHIGEPREQLVELDPDLDKSLGGLPGL
mmetsp:Transcript_17886/g.37996  ORF Transcript_17886/g.37996 Transcript_17886/m.37996 type:complete len:263 (+) Transcript_17886:1474-2262(+)